MKNKVSANYADFGTSFGTSQNLIQLLIQPCLTSKKKINFLQRKMVEELMDYMDSLVFVDFPQRCYFIHTMSFLQFQYFPAFLFFFSNCFQPLTLLLRSIYLELRALLLLYSKVHFDGCLQINHLSISFRQGHKGRLKMNFFDFLHLH